MTYKLYLNDNLLALNTFSKCVHLIYNCKCFYVFMIVYLLSKHMYLQSLGYIYFVKQHSFWTTHANMDLSVQNDTFCCRGGEKDV